jgi:hypothetical protein
MILKQPKCPSADKWVLKIWCISAVKYYSTKKRGNPVICDAHYEYIEQDK